MSKRIPLTQNKYAIVDNEDYESVSRFRWYAVNCSGLFYAKTGTHYATTHMGSRRKRWQGHMYLHRFLLHPPKGFVVDHINSNALDCRRSNMRVCTQAQNIYNTRKLHPGLSQYKGIKWHNRDHVWEAYVHAEGRRFYLGRSPHEEIAAQMYDKGACEIHGEYACVNFPCTEKVPSVAV